MHNFLRYTLLLLTLFLVIIFYFFNTNMGREDLKEFIENSLAKKTDNKIEVTSLNLDHYPNLLIKLKVNMKLYSAGVAERPKASGSRPDGLVPSGVRIPAPAIDKSESQ